MLCGGMSIAKRCSSRSRSIPTRPTQPDRAGRTLTAAAPIEKARPIGRAFEIFTLYIQNIKSDGVHPPHFPTLYLARFAQFLPIDKILLNLKISQAHGCHSDQSRSERDGAGRNLLFPPAQPPFRTPKTKGATHRPRLRNLYPIYSEYQIEGGKSVTNDNFIFAFVPST
jgi:hypothetical protein